MAYQHETVDVRISQRTLWVGSHVYPLQNVTRIRSMEEVIDRGGLTWNLAKTIARTLIGGLVALIVVACADPTHVLPQMLIMAGTLAILGWQIYQGIKEMRRARLHLLIIETAGAAHTAVASTSRATIADLTDKITEAIDNPAVNYAVKIDVVEGDQINQLGLNNTVTK